MSKYSVSDLNIEDVTLEEIVADIFKGNNNDARIS